MDFFVFAFIFFALYGIKPAQSSNYGINNFSVSQCNNLKGVFAVFVMLHHISQCLYAYETDKPFDLLFRFIYGHGNYATSVFFLISGYGLAVQFLTHGKEYIKSFPKKRLLSVLIPRLLAFFIYWCISWIYTKVSFETAFLSLLGGRPIISNSWYVLSIIYFYIAFFITAVVVGNNKKPLFIASVTSFWVIFCVYCLARGYNSWWITTAHCFVIGIILGMYREKIAETVCSYYTATVAAVLAVLAVFEILNLFSVNSVYINSAVTVCRTALFSVLIVLLSLKFKIGNTAVRFIGGISYELYLIHGIVIGLLLNYKILPRYGDVVFVVLALVLSLISAVLYNAADRLIFKVIRRQ